MVSRPRVTVRGIIYQDGKLFLQKLKGDGESPHTFWSTPGGKLDEGEDLISGLRREIVEETNVEPIIGKLLFMQQFIDGKDREWLEFFYHIENAQDYAAIDLEATTHGTLEVVEFGFINPEEATVLPAGVKDMNLAELIAGNQPVQLLNYL